MDSEENDPLNKEVVTESLKNATKHVQLVEADQNNFEEQKQAELYTKTLKQNSLHDVHRVLSSHEAPTRSKSQSRRPVSARSTTFSTTSSLKRSQSAASNLHDPYLRSSNDFKYIGDQFVAGKLDPKLLPAHEIRFQRLHSARLKKLRMDMTNSKNLLQTFNQFRKSKDMGLFDKTEAKFLTNDFKYTGDQFKVGKIDPKIESPVEKRFKRLFVERLNKLHPDESKAPTALNYAELKELHTMRAIPRVK